MHYCTQKMVMRNIILLWFDVIQDMNAVSRTLGMGSFFGESILDDSPHSHGVKIFLLCLNNNFLKNTIFIFWSNHILKWIIFNCHLSTSEKDADALFISMFSLILHNTSFLISKKNSCILHNYVAYCVVNYVDKRYNNNSRYLTLLPIS